MKNGTGSKSNLYDNVIHEVFNHESPYQFKKYLMLSSKEAP
jgi:hypothetical protein